MEKEKRSVESLDSSDSPQSESQEMTASTCVPKYADPPDSRLCASDKMTPFGVTAVQVKKTSGSANLVTSDPNGTETSETKDLTPTEVSVAEHGKESKTFRSNKIETSDSELLRHSPNSAENEEVTTPGPSVTESKDIEAEVAELQVSVPDELTVSGSEDAEASGLQDVTLSNSEEETLFERDSKFNILGNPDEASVEKEIAGKQSFQGKKNCLSSTFLQLRTGSRCFLLAL